MTGPELSIVMPVYKEGEAIVPAVEALARDIRTSHEILVVYDFDEDPTVPVIERWRPRTRRSVACATTSAGACSTR